MGKKPLAPSRRFSSRACLILADSPLLIFTLLSPPPITSNRRPCQVHADGCARSPDTLSSLHSSRSVARRFRHFYVTTTTLVYLIHAHSESMAPVVACPFQKCVQYGCGPPQPGCYEARRTVSNFPSLPFPFFRLSLRANPGSMVVSITIEPPTQPPLSDPHPYPHSVSSPSPSLLNTPPPSALKPLPPPNVPKVCQN